MVHLPVFYDGVPNWQKEKYLQFKIQYPYHFYTIDGLEWSYISKGKGKMTIVFLPGLVFDVNMWFYPILELEKSVHILAINLPLTLPSPDAIVKSVSQIIAEQSEGKVIIMGTSFTGLLAHHLIERFPDRFQKVIISHTDFPTAQAKKSMRHLIWLARLAPLSKIINVFRKRRKYFPDSPWNEFVVAYLNEILQKVNKKMLINQFRAFNDLYQLELKSVQDWEGEALIVSSLDDRRTLQSVPLFKGLYQHCREYIFKKGGHYPIGYFPEEFTRMIEDFREEVK